MVEKTAELKVSVKAVQTDAQSVDQSVGNWVVRWVVWMVDLTAAQSVDLRVGKTAAW